MKYYARYYIYKGLNNLILAFFKFHQKFQTNFGVSILKYIYNYIKYPATQWRLT